VSAGARDAAVSADASDWAATFGGSWFLGVSEEAGAGGGWVAAAAEAGGCGGAEEERPVIADMKLEKAFGRGAGACEDDEAD
jgi:hypothetical protein